MIKRTRIGTRARIINKTKNRNQSKNDINKTKNRNYSKNDINKTKNRNYSKNDVKTQNNRTRAYKEEQEVELYKNAIKKET